MGNVLKALTTATMLAFFASTALAAPPPPKGKAKKAAKKETKKEKKSDDPKVIAKKAYEGGKKAFEEGDYQTALEQFTLANETLPNPFVYLKIAECYEKLGNMVEAISWLEKYVEEKPEASNTGEIKAKIAELSGTPGKVAVASEPPGASIILDEEDTGKLTPDELQIKPGEHTIVLKVDGYVDQSKTFEMAPGGSLEVSMELEEEAAEEMISEEYPEEEITEEEELEIPVEEEEAAEGPEPVNKGVWAAAGIAGAGIISATVFGILALNKEADFEDAKDQGRKEDETEAEYRDRLDDIKGKGKAFAIACDVSWGVAAAATLAGIITYYVTKAKAGKEKKEKEEETIGNLTISPMVSSKTAGAALGFTF